MCRTAETDRRDWTVRRVAGMLFTRPAHISEARIYKKEWGRNVHLGSSAAAAVCISRRAPNDMIPLLWLHLHLLKTIKMGKEIIMEEEDGEDPTRYSCCCCLLLLLLLWYIGI